MTRVTHELCITRIGFTHDPYSWGIQLAHEPLKRKIYIKKKITRARHGAPPGVPHALRARLPSRISWFPSGAARAPYGLRPARLRLASPPPFRGNESFSVVRGVGHTGLRPFFPSPLPGAWPLRFSVKGSRFAPKSSPVRCSGLRPCAPLRLPVSPLTLPLRSTAGQPNSRQQAKTARSGVFWPWWYIRQGWGKKTRCRPVSGLSGGIGGGRVKGAKRPRLAGAARSAARTRARRGEPLTRPERPSLCEWGQDEGRSPPPCPPSLPAARAGRQGEAAPGAAPLSLSGG